MAAPIFSHDSKGPLSPKEIVSELEKHPKFRAILTYNQEYPEKCNYKTIQNRVEQSTYTLKDIMQDLLKLFIGMYTEYPRSSEIYASATELESYLNNLIDVQKSKTQEKKF